MKSANCAPKRPIGYNPHNFSMISTIYYMVPIFRGLSHPSYKIISRSHSSSLYVHARFI